MFKIYVSKPQEDIYDMYMHWSKSLRSNCTYRKQEQTWEGEGSILIGSSKQPQFSIGGSI